MTTIPAPPLALSEQAARRAVTGGREVFGEVADEHATDETRQGGGDHAVPQAQSHADEDDRQTHQGAGRIDAAAQTAQQHFLRCAFLGADEEGANHADDQTGRGHQQREELTGQLHVLGQAGAKGRQRDGGDDRTGITLEKIGAHASHVADVVAHVVGDGRRIAGIILRDARFGLPHQVGADVGRLGVDAAADAGENGDRGAAEAEAGQGACRLGRGQLAAEQDKKNAHAQQRQGDDHRAHHRAAGEGHPQPAVEALGRGLRRAHVGAHGDIHADVTGQAGRQRPADEGDRRPDAHAAALQAGKQDQHQRNQDDQNAHGTIFTRQKGLGAALNRTRNALHGLVARVLGHDEIPLPEREAQPDQAGYHPQRARILYAHVHASPPACLSAWPPRMVAEARSVYNPAAREWQEQNRIEGMQTRRTGRLGEDLATRYLQRRGYDILASNWRCPHGELDIVARIGGKLVFLEVRTRRQSDTEEAFASITARKRERLLAAIHEWLESNRQQDADWQVDVIGVALGARTKIDHVEDALDW